MNRVTSAVSPAPPAITSVPDNAQPDIIAARLARDIPVLRRTARRWYPHIDRDELVEAVLLRASAHIYLVDAPGLNLRSWLLALMRHEVSTV
jgi:hypothetical protein